MIGIRGFFWLSVLLLSSTILSFSILPTKAQPLLSDSLSRLQPEAQPVKPFAFAVAGNTRHTLPYLISPEFQTILARVNERQPPFLVLLGDLIKGRNITTAPRQWDEFHATIAPHPTPTFTLPGDHDIWNPASLHLWQQRMGKCWYSFDYSNSHFIFLDSQATPRAGITGDQLEWLKSDLRQSKAAKSIFVFVHRPLFLDFTTNWERVHRLLRRYPVKAVFASHHQRYEMLRPRDRIAYHITGGGGSEIAELPEVGGFPHWLLVSVDGEQHRVVVMKTKGGSLPAHTVRSQDRSAILAARRAIAVNGVQGQVGSNLSGDTRVFLKNRRPVAASGRLTWHAPNIDWEFDRNWRLYRLASYGKATAGFHVRTTTPAALLGPLPHLSADYSYGYGHDGKPIKLTYGLPVVRNMDIPPAARRVVADGRLDEWEGIKPLALVNRLGSEPASEADFSASVRMMWSPKRFYIALEVRDDFTTLASVNAEGEWDVDNFRLTFNPFEKGRGSRRGGRYEYVGSLSTKGARLYLLSDPAASGQHRPAPDVEMGVIRKNGTITYELVFNDASLSPLALKAGDRFAMNLLVGDDDGPCHPEKFTLLALAGKGATPYELWPHIIVNLTP